MHGTTTQAAGTQGQERYSLDGREVELGEFLRDNAETFTIADAERFARMQPGDEVLVGGGAGAAFLLRREA
jgi:hypothetical protein